MIYLSFMLLTACTNPEEKERIKQTMEVMAAVKEPLALLGDKKQHDANIWHDAYLKLDITLEQSAKADSEAVELAKEARNLFESLYDFRKDNDLTAVNTLMVLAHAVNTLTGRGDSITELNKRTSLQQKQITDQYIKVKFRTEKLSIKLCNRYQILCDKT